MNTAPIEIRKNTSHIPHKDLSQKVNSMVSNLTKQLSLTTKWHEESRSVLFEAESGIARGTTGHLQIGPGWINLVVRLSTILQVQRESVEQVINTVIDEALAG